jgi:hypothetical protein
VAPCPRQHTRMAVSGSDGAWCSTPRASNVAQIAEALHVAIACRSGTCPPAAWAALYQHLRATYLLAPRGNGEVQGPHCRRL